MEAMTQEFMLHSRPQAEIWSAREGSDDDMGQIHLNNKTLMARSHPSQPRTNKRSTSETKIWWISTKKSTSETKTDESPNSISNHDPLQQPKADGSQQTHPNVRLIHLRNKASDGSTQDMNQTQVFFPGSDYTSYKAIGGKSQILTKGFSVDESHVAELANHN